MKVEAGRPSQRLSLEVILTVKHRVTVKVDCDSTESIEDLKDKALAEFHKGERGTGLRSDDTWRFQFANRSNIDVGSEEVSVAEVRTRPKGDVPW